MNKARLFTVDSNTIISTKNSGMATIFCPQLDGTQWVKTVADIMADLLQIEIGDYIFLWERKSGNQKSRIHGVYRAISNPYFDNSDPNDGAPFKIRIEEAYHFENPIEEYEVLNCPFVKDPLWTIMGKKVADKARGTSPLSMKEAEILITLLIGNNPDWTYNDFDYSNTISMPNPLIVNYQKCGSNPDTSSIAALDINSVNFFDDGHNVHYEKILETIFNQEATKRNQSFFSQIGIDINKVSWYCNYLPYSLEQSEMDYVIVESEDGNNISKIFVIEFMTGYLDEDHLHRVCMYSKWVNNTLALGTNFVFPIVISKTSVDFINGETSKRKNEKLQSLKNRESADINTYEINPVSVYTYDFSSGTPVFIKKK